MASVSATCLKFQSLPSRFSRTSQCRRLRKLVHVLVSVNLQKCGFFSWKSSRFHVSSMVISSPLGPPTPIVEYFTVNVTRQAKPETVYKVCEIVRKQLALGPASELTPESKFSALGADSLDTVEFDISVEEESSQNISTIQDAAGMIEKLVQKKAEA